MNKVFSSCVSGSVRKLLDGGFKHIGVWHACQNGLIEFHGIKPIPSNPGVYAYAVGDEVVYVGSAQSGLNKRFQHYKSSKKLRTASCIREAILERLSHGTRVDVYVIVPKESLTLNGVLPVDPVAGLEEGLIRDIKPTWNRRGSRAV